MVKKFRLTGAKKVLTPIDLDVHSLAQQSLSRLSQEAQIEGIPYSEAIGSALWPTVVLWPDTAYAVGVLSQFIQNPGPAHWEGVKQVISYLWNTKDLWLTSGRNKQTLLEGYCDANWGGQVHQHSISGFSFYYGHRAILWSSKKQNIIALLSTKAEYVAETHAAKEGIWLKTFVKEMTGQETRPITIMTDNQGAIVLAKDNKFMCVPNTST